MGTVEFLAVQEKLKIGPTNVESRVKQHLRDERLVRTAKSARYMLVADKEETCLVGHIPLSDYIEQTANCCGLTELMSGDWSCRDHSDAMCH